MTTVQTDGDYRAFRLAFADGKSLVVAERELPLMGAVNFRDVGGYRTRDGRYTRWGRVYRAGLLNTLTADDHALLSRLGVRMVCDLRTDEETTEDPDHLPPDTDYRHIPVQSGSSRAGAMRRLLLSRGRMDDVMTRAYTDIIVDRNPAVYAQVFRHIAATGPGRAVVIHCTAGKDRTGVAIALLLDVLGVPDEVIIADYSLSNRHFDSFVAAGEKAIQSLGRFGLRIETLLPLFTAHPATIEATLAHVRRRYGSSESYLIAGGLEPEALEQIRTNLLQPATA